MKFRLGGVSSQKLSTLGYITSVIDSSSSFIKTIPLLHWSSLSTTLLYLVATQEQFPPSVYYKVFTYQNIVDLGAYSPRDYTAMSWKQPLPQDVHNKGSLSTQSECELVNTIKML